METLEQIKVAAELLSVDATKVFGGNIFLYLFLQY